MDELMTETVKTRAGDVVISVSICSEFGRSLATYRAEYKTRAVTLDMNMMVPVGGLGQPPYSYIRERLLRDLGQAAFQEVA